ncbi:MAG: hypothetical protein GF331_24290 [Chitinivibrionales bacterium]|nr:hypothetical protein [Chitinivibrionales bacterium]
MLPRSPQVRLLRAAEGTATRLLAVPRPLVCPGVCRPSRRIAPVVGLTADAPRGELMDNQERHTLGIPEMDTQHTQLYSLFDRLESSPTVRDREATAALLSQIEGYLLFHFESEEHFIRLYKAPGFAAHQTDHEQAAAKVVEFLDDFEAGRLNPVRLKIFLTGWLMEHSRSADEQYAAFIREARANAR